MITPSGSAFATGSQQLQRLQLQRAAEQAEQRAQRLEQASRQARAEAVRADQRSRSLQTEAVRAQADAQNSRRGLRASEGAEQIVERLNLFRAEIRPEAAAVAAVATAPSTPAPSSPIVASSAYQPSSAAVGALVSEVA